jgi:chromate reductase, NAD(P)H dehydrogenase (quinone)
MAAKTVLAICGSTRRQSTNLLYIDAIRNLTAGDLTITLFEGLDALPHFNPDLDIEPAPATVAAFRKALRESEGILICTPEYAMGVPGTLKNAIDWTVSSADFSKKPTVLITASSQGENAHASLLKTLRIIEARIPDELQLHIPFAKARISTDAVITDDTARKNIEALAAAFIQHLNA